MLILHVSLPLCVIAVLGSVKAAFNCPAQNKSAELRFTVELGSKFYVRINHGVDIPCCAEGYENITWYKEVNGNWKPVPSESEVLHDGQVLQLLDIKITDAATYRCYVVGPSKGIYHDTQIVVEVTDINECLQNPCLNGGTCTNTLGSYTCQCTPQWLGPRCEIDYNECLDISKCHSGGQCTNTEGVYTCRCPTGRTGQNCLIDIDECLTNPCLNGATCINNAGSYTCHCPVGYTEKNCETDVDECLEPGICKNGGTCINTQGSYLCNCPQQWTGTHCENDVNECKMGLSRCENNATCFNTVGEYECLCLLGYTGPLCTAADPCAPDKNNVMLPDTRDKSAYFICYNGSGHPSTCGKDRVFDPVRSICTSP